MTITTRETRSVQGMPLWTSWKMDAYVLQRTIHICDHCGREDTLAQPHMKMRLKLPDGGVRLVHLHEVQQRYQGLFTVLGNAQQEFMWPELPFDTEDFTYHVQYCAHCVEGFMSNQWKTRPYRDSESYLPRSKEELFNVIAPALAKADGFQYESIDAALLGGGNLRPEIEHNKPKRKSKSRRIKSKAKPFSLADAIKNLPS